MHMCTYKKSGCLLALTLHICWTVPCLIQLVGIACHVTCLLTPRSFKAEKSSACSQFPKYNRSGMISPGYLQNQIMHSMPTVM